MINVFFPLISFVFVSGLIIFLLFKKPYNKLFTILITLLVCINFWLFGTAQMFYNEHNYQLVIFWDKFVYLGVTLLPALYLHFVLIFTKAFSKLAIQKHILLVVYLLAITFFIFSRSDLFINGVFEYSWGVHTQAKILHHIFLGFFEVNFIFGLILLYRYQRLVADLLEKKRTKYIIFAFLWLFGVSSVAFLPAYGIPIYPIPFLSGVFFTGLIVYAITRYRSFNVHLTFRQHWMKAIIVISGSMVAGIFVYGLSRLELPVGVVASGAVIMFAGIQFLLLYIVQHYLTRGEVDLSVPDQFKGSNLVQTHLEELLQNITQEFTKMASVKNLTICIYHHREHCYQALHTNLFFSDQHALIHYFKTVGLVFRTTHQQELKTMNVMMSSELQDLMKKHKFTHAVALSNYQQIYGVVFFNAVMQPGTNDEGEALDCWHQLGNRFGLLLQQLLIFESLTNPLNFTKRS